jgi:hypothetical protein
MATTITTGPSFMGPSIRAPDSSVNVRRMPARAKATPMRTRALAFLALIPIALVSCSGATTSGSSGGASGSGGPLGAPGSLAGTWDFSGSTTNGKPTSGVLDVDADTFHITIDRTDLMMKATGNQAVLTYTDGSNAPVINTAHASSAMSLGAIPLAFAGGQWTFTGDATSRGANVTTTVSSSAVTAQGSNVDGHPQGLPDLNGSFTAGRTSQLDSIFGDLGGEWVLTASDTTIDAKFSGSTVAITVSGRSATKPGSLTVTVGDGIVSGTTTDGFEFSARRR